MQRTPTETRNRKTWLFKNFEDTVYTTNLHKIRIIGVILWQSINTHKWKTTTRHGVGLMQTLSTAHGSYGRHIRFCYRNRQVTRWRSSWHDYCPDYGGWWPPQNLGRSSISRRSMVLSEGERTITTRSFNIGLHESVWRWNNCVGATSRYRRTDRQRQSYEYWNSCIYPRFLLQHPLVESTPDTIHFLLPYCYTPFLLNSTTPSTLTQALYIHCENRSLRPWPVWRGGGEA